MAAKFSLTSEPIKVAVKPSPDPVAPAPVAPVAAAPEIETAPEKPAPPAPPVAPEKMYRVLADAKVARGGSHYTLRKGRIISEHGYDIEFLRSLKVQLEAVNAP
jgi:hypothetical protein